jgi:hypothetical protein
MIIATKLDIVHLELIKIFCKANDLVGVEISEVPMEVNGRFHMVLQLECKYEPTSAALTFMGFRHCGILNMLDDYLLKCGVDPGSLQPASIQRQIQEEREAKQNAAFVEHLEKCVKAGQLTKVI